MTTTCIGDGRGNVISLQIAEGTKTSGLTMSSSIVRENIERSSPHAFGQPDDVGVILGRGQTVHEDDNGARLAHGRPGADGELDTVTCQQPRVLNGHFGHFAPLGRPKRRRACTRWVAQPANLPKRGVSVDYLRVISAKRHRVPGQWSPHRCRPIAQWASSGAIWNAPDALTSMDIYGTVRGRWVDLEGIYHQR